MAPGRSICGCILMGDKTCGCRASQAAEKAEAGQSDEDTVAP